MAKIVKKTPHPNKTKILNSKLLIKNLEIENRKITVEIEIK